MISGLAPSVRSAKLNIAVLGAGAIGSTFAFQLARVGEHNVTVIARSGSVRLEQLRRDRAIVNVLGERASVEVADRIDPALVYDVILVTLLAHQVQAVSPDLRESKAKWIQFMFNTFDPESVQTQFGQDRCSFGMPFVQSRLDNEGRIDAKIGAFGQKTKMSEAGLAAVFNGSGLPAIVEPKMLLWLRCHAPLCIAFESVSLAAVRARGGAPWSGCLAVAQGLQESFSLSQRLGYKRYPSGKVRLQRSPLWIVAGLLWFVSRIPSFRDLLATGIKECCALIDVLVADAARVHPPVLVNRILAMNPLSEGESL